LVAQAPVKAPFSYPNSSDSINDSGIAGQVTFTSERFDRFERAWRSRTNISFPVPLSPWISTGTDVSAVLSSFFLAVFIAVLVPNITSEDSDSSSAPRLGFRVNAMR
jgi:hypothetical protein